MITIKDLPIDDKYPNSCVYWLYHEDLHTDYKTQGYVGVSVHGGDNRFSLHKSDAKKGSKLPVHNAIRKYGSSIKIKILILANPEFCLLVEEMLRPVPNMVGTYNINAGGGSSKGRLGLKCTEETKALMRVNNSGKNNPNFGKKTADSTLSKMRKPKLNTENYKLAWTDCRKQNQSQEYSAWCNHNANQQVWALASKIEELMLSGKGTTTIGKSIGFTHNTIKTVYKKIKSGWNPNEDAAYLVWLSEYKQKQELANDT